jgi:hypothetical protein
MPATTPGAQGHRSTAVPPRCPADPVRSKGPVSPRALALGLLLVPLLAGWSLKQELIHGGTEFVEASLVVVAVFTIFVLALGNEALRRRAPRLAFSRGELLTVYVMLTTSLGVAGLGGIQVLVQTLGAPFHFATPENGWARLHPHLPRWLTPDPEVLAPFYKGDSTLFSARHLLGWAAPVAAWSVFLLALLAATFCLAVMVRRPWMEQERLTFPLVYLPLELTRTETTRSLIGSRLFWAAFGIVFVFRSVTGLHYLVPSVPDWAGFADEGQSFALEAIFVDPPWSAIGYSRLSFHPVIVGLTYFLPLDVAFSAPFFYLLTKAEQIGAAAYGWHGTGGMGAQPPYIAEQGAGAFLAIALFSLLGARRHLRAVFQKAFFGDPRVEDRDEPLSYRAAVYGFLAASGVLFLFAVAARLPAPVALAFFALYLLYLLTLTRLRAEAGPMLLYFPDVTPHRLMTDVAGTRHWSPQSAVAFSSFLWFGTFDQRTVAMPQQMEAMKIAESARISARRLTFAIAAATVLAVIAAFLAVLAIYYVYGASTPRGGNSWRVEQGRLPFERVGHWLGNPTDTDLTALLAMAGGGAGAAGLAALRARFLGWPLHPSGFALAHASLAMTWVWFPMLMSWAVKALLLRYGGIRLFRAGVPFALGLILGDIVVGVLWALLGAVLDQNVYMFFPG